MNLNACAHKSVACEAVDDIGFVSQALDGAAQFIAKFFQIMTTQVLHLNALQTMPNTLSGIQFRGIVLQSHLR